MSEDSLQTDVQITVQNDSVLDLYYNKCVKYIDGMVFEVNPYDICVANQIKPGKQQTVTFNVGDLKYIHIS